jgi:uncharacterized protein YigE (DUF2233 family)
MRTLSLVALLLLIASARNVSAAPGVTIRTVDHLGDKYTVVTVRLGEGSTVRLYGETTGLTFSDARAAAQREGRQAVALMNGGMYGPEGGPIGLFIAEGKERHAISLGDGDGNFHMKPNGVFWLDASGRAHVTVSDVFPASRSSVTFATQSGPMLLIKGAVHPTFRPDSPNRLVRNGVGVPVDGKTVQLVISNGPVRFHDFATLFRDVLACQDALYLDGTVSSLWSGADMTASSYGVVIAVEAANR